MAIKKKEEPTPPPKRTEAETAAVLQEFLADVVELQALEHQRSEIDQRISALRSQVVEFLRTELQLRGFTL